MSSDIELFSNDELREQQIINDLQLKINKQKEKVSKKATRQKILLGAFFVDALENNRIEGLRDYTAKNLPLYLTKDIDKKLLQGLVENLGGNMGLEKQTKNEGDERNNII